jgi:hypothetical protein
MTTIIKAVKRSIVSLKLATSLPPRHSPRVRSARTRTAVASCQGKSPRQTLRLKKMLLAGDPALMS